MKNTKPFPKPIPFGRLLGPSFIILALGLGSGEVILWPYLASNYGLGIAWGALLGITFQYFINMEIERYALVKGESVFVGIKKIFKLAPHWFILSTFIGFGLPGIVAASAKVFGNILGIEEFKWIAIGLLLVIGLILSVGKTVYKTMETLTKTILLLGVPFVFILAVILSDFSAWENLGKGLIGQGEGFTFLPEGIVIASFFAAFAYSGAGGNLNLTQSIYVKEKGYGMGKFAQKIGGLFRSKQEQVVKLEGEDFEVNEENLGRFKIWWKRVSLEHFIVFWCVGLFSMLMLMLLAYSTVFGLSDNQEGINFVINQGSVIGSELASWVGTLFLVVVGVMLFQTQLGVMDSTSRIMAENLALEKIDKSNSPSTKGWQTKSDGVVSSVNLVAKTTSSEQVGDSSRPHPSPLLKGEGEQLNFGLEGEFSSIEQNDGILKQVQDDNVANDGIPAYAGMTGVVQGNSKINLSKIYFSFLWAQIAFGIILFLLNISEPKTLIVLGAVINAFAMFVHTGLVSIANYKILPKEVQPKLWRKIILAGIFIFFGIFSVITLVDKIG